MVDEYKSLYNKYARETYFREFDARKIFESSLLFPGDGKVIVQLRSLVKTREAEINAMRETFGWRILERLRLLKISSKGLVKGVIGRFRNLLNIR